MKALWLDDFRDPGYFLFCDMGFKKEDVVVCKNYKEFVSEIELNGLPDWIFFDHDLGSDKTGYDCAKWLVQYCTKNNCKLPNYDSQSANTVGRFNILSLLDAYKKHSM